MRFYWREVGDYGHIVVFGLPLVTRSVDAPLCDFSCCLRPRQGCIPKPINLLKVVLSRLFTSDGVKMSDGR